MLLSGYIGSDAEKKVALKIVKSVKGVKSVDEDIRVANYDTYREIN